MSSKYLLNLERIEFLLDYYKLSKKDFIKLLNEKKYLKQLTYNDLTKEVSTSTLKRIDSIFNKGISWYINKNKPTKIQSSSIFYRKNKFNSNKLNYADIKIISKFENKRIQFNILSKNLNIDISRKIKIYSISECEKKVADYFRSEFEKKYNKKINDEREYLKILYNIIEDYNVLIFENYEQWNVKHKSNFEGFYLKNMIVLNKQSNIRRQIFTLMHEFAHFLLDKEEIDEDIDTSVENLEILKIENWCNNFAFYFLLGEKYEEFESITFCKKSNNYNKKSVFNIVDATYLNSMSIYTKLKLKNKISSIDYNLLKKESDLKFNEILNLKKKEQEAKSRENTLKKLKKLNLEITEENIKKFKSGGRLKPKFSDLFENVVNINYSRGSINEVELCNYLEFSKKKRENFLEGLNY